MRGYRHGSGQDRDAHELDTGDLERIIGRLTNLHHFTWDVNRDIPNCLLSKLEQQWPKAYLSIGDHDRAMTDFRALTSPLTQSMNFCILNHTATITATDQLEQYSKLPELRDILLKVPQLRKLNIKFVYNWIPRHVEWVGPLAHPRLLNFPLKSSDRLPTLTDLTFSGPPETYEFNLEHCQLLRHCVDFSHIRRLDFGISCPQFFFEEIGPHLRNLRSLTMGIRTGNRRYTHWPQGPLTCNNFDTIYHFLDYKPVLDVPALDELRITNFNAAPASDFINIFETQSSLRVFSYHASLNRPRKLEYALSINQLREIQDRFGDLSHLELDLPLLGGKWPLRHAKAVSRFNHLTTLILFIELGADASDFAGEFHQDSMGSVPFPPINAKLARQVTIDLFKSFFTHDAYARLQNLEVRFLHQRIEDRGQKFDTECPVKIRRAIRDDAPSPLEGGFTIECKDRWTTGY
ncbi:MAG: hypothetical protein Q9220_006758 [cf. Caloplaca sp. 1 TL-2023]